jgi:hypothetical protein
MAKLWTDEHKHKAKDAFEQAPDEGPVNQPPRQQRPPQPQLTPKGPMRSAVDAQIREQESAKRVRIEKRKQEIEAKLENDRIKEQALER